MFELEPGESLEQWKALCAVSTFFTVKEKVDSCPDTGADWTTYDCDYDMDQVITRTNPGADVFLIDGDMLEAWSNELPQKMPAYDALTICQYTKLVVVTKDAKRISTDLAKYLLSLWISVPVVEFVEWESDELFNLIDEECSYTISVESLMDGYFEDGEISYSYDLFKALGEIK